MLSLIEVECPHCGARGQIMVPPVGAIIIGPCPQCKELVVVFCGHVLPLEKDIMDGGTVDDRREHLLEVLTEFLQDRIGQLLSDEALADAVEEEFGDRDLLLPERAVAEEAQTSGGEAPISESEFERFTDVDLKLLDNKAYFKSVFG